jgi:hypothetical protein
VRRWLPDRHRLRWALVARHPLMRLQLPEDVVVDVMVGVAEPARVRLRQVLLRQVLLERIKTRISRMTPRRLPSGLAAAVEDAGLSRMVAR